MQFDPRQVLVSCEHASNRLPDGMEGSDDMLNLHIAWDVGALPIAEYLACTFDAPLHKGEYSRLVVDLNRTIGNSRLIRRISDGHRIPFNRRLTNQEVERRVELYYNPYRRAVIQNVAEIKNREGRCIHLSIHTFTPVFQDKTRSNDIGLMYDPRRNPEAELVHEMRTKLAERTKLVVWLNKPYLGTADGFLPRLREQHQANHYVGIELEVNQKHTDAPDRLTFIAESFGCVLKDLNWATETS